MAWNTGETRRRIKDAATAEFAAHGLHGTTMERIAGRAGVNKERVYNYFGCKDDLFALVLSDELARVAAAVPLESLREDDVGEYAGRVFDYHAEHPQLARLLHWEGLAYGDDEVPDERTRAAHYRGKAAVFAAAQRDGLLADEPGAAYMVFLVLALAAGWFAIPQVARMLTGKRSDVAAERARRRAAVVEAARRLARVPVEDQWEPVTTSTRSPSGSSR